MSKKCKNTQKQPQAVSEPMIPYGVNAVSNAIGVIPSSREIIMRSTMSVDEYFDKLISLVHQDYENLHSED